MLSSCARAVAWARRWLVVGLLLNGGWANPGQAQTLQIRPPTAALPPRVSLAATPEQWVVLESSADLRSWTELGRGQGPVVEAPDLQTPGADRAFYRAALRLRTDEDVGKQWLNYADEPFRSPEPPFGVEESRWVKFALLHPSPSSPSRIVFQDSARYAFHYDFAVKELPEFRGLSRAQFDAVTLHTNSQQAVLGAVLFPPTATIREIGVQLVGADPYPREAVVAWLGAVRVSLGLPDDVRFLYLPTFEQSAVARQEAEWLAARGVTVASPARWAVQDQCYAPGWTVGRLVFVPGNEIAAAYREGRLLPADLLLTDAVPAEVPPVAGILSLTPGTPNSHVALLAQSLGIPFVYFIAEEMQAQLRSWVGRDVVLRVVELFGGCEITAAPLVEPLPEAMRAEILQLKVPPALDLPPKQAAGKWLVPVEGLRPVDRRTVGGKAANFGVLVAAAPTNAPRPAVAIPFDLWDAFLDQPLPAKGGVTLRAEIARELSGFTWPPSMAALQPALERVRSLIRNDADFTADQKAALLAGLQAAGLPTERNVRFRSSTNVEDGDAFNGAGLYDSYSGCLADDLDANNAGPSRCDPTEPNERGVFRALRRVFASFYNDNAVLERLRHRVDETIVGMAVLVHPSTPDADEQANGVATLTIFRSGVAGEERGLSATFVSQVGAVSVTNPDSAVRPEVMKVTLLGDFPPFLEVQSRSSLVPLGGTVFASDAEYLALHRLLDHIAQEYESTLPKPRNLVLDFEYKKVAPGTLQVKQVREVPPADVDREFTPWLLDTSNRLEVFQGEHGDLLATHRLKSSWNLAVRPRRVRAAELATSPFREVAGQWREGMAFREVRSAPEALPGYSFVRSVAGLTTRDRWSSGTGAEARTMEVQVEYQEKTTGRQGPLTLLGDHFVQLNARYATPQPTLGFEPRFTNTLAESVRLVSMPATNAASLLQERTFRKGAWEVRTRFYWPPYPKGIVAGYTAPLQAWVETRITGLTAAPIVLRGPWSQTYHPGHHNFYEEFAFEPRLEEGLDPATLAELERLDIRGLILAGGNGDPAAEWILWGSDGKFRVP